MKKLLILVASLTTLALSLSQAAAAPNPLVIAHRGASAQAPENTLPAFQLAWEQGADGIATDYFGKPRDPRNPGAVPSPG